MQKFHVFSKRQNPIQHEIFTYEDIPEKLRNQIFFIWKNGLAIDSYAAIKSNVPYQSFNFIKEVMCKEHGLLSLRKRSNTTNVGAECVDFLRHEPDPLKVLDIIEISLYVMKTLSENKSTYELERIGITQMYDDVIEDLNDRFKENGVGYAYLGDKIVRKDSEFLHENTVKPAISLLYESEFEGAAEEFLHAHELFRIGKNKEAIVEALKSFESTMKTICNKKSYSISGKGTAAGLIKTLFDNDFIPAHLQTHLNSLKTTLEGLPTIRNNNGGHGQGEVSTPVSNYIVSYALNLCATNVVFLVEAYKDSIKKNK